MNPLFVNADNTSRIYGIWDQLDNMKYSKEDIDKALQSASPYDVVMQRDTNGHGTYIAGLACGNVDEQNDFYGMAPLSYIGVVKLKEAKPYLKEYYGVSQQVECYQENDIMLGIDYLVQMANELKCPLVICLAIGTNLGDHNGNGFLGLYVDYIAGQVGKAVICATGNEANAAHHFQGKLEMEAGYEDVEIRVGEETKGFTLQLWVRTPDRMAVGFASPTGEVFEKVSAKINGSSVLKFSFEDSIIYVDYWIFQQAVGDELIEMRFFNPTPGIWTVRIYNEGVIDGGYNLWLPVSKMIEGDTFFLRPEPDITVTEPGNSSFCVTVGGYNHRNGSIYISSGRGNARDGRTKPDIVAPAVDVSGPGLRNYFVRTGTSSSVALCAGAAALVFQWAFVKENDIRMNGNVLRKYLILGADRTKIREYPNREWGYGVLNIYNVFNVLRKN